MLVLCPAQHGVQGVRHLVKQVVQGREGEKGGRPPGGRGQVQHEDHHGVLVGEVAVLVGFTGPSEEVAVDVAEVKVCLHVGDGDLVYVGRPQLALLGSLHDHFHAEDIHENVVESFHGDAEREVLGKFLNVNVEPGGSRMLTEGVDILRSFREAVCWYISEKTCYHGD